MESNTNEQDPSPAEIELDEPHFDEATLLTARPVVPLEVVEAKSRSLNRVLIGSAIVVALFIGVFAASFIYRSRGVTPKTSAAATEDAPAQSELAVEGGVAAVESPEIEPVAELQEPVVEPEETEPVASDRKQPNERPAVKNAPANSSPVISRRPPPARQVNRPANDEADYGALEEDIARQRELDKEIRRAERREERRALRREERRSEMREERRPRRVEKEAKHQGGDRPTDDLSRIREIFEGRPKP